MITLQNTNVPSELLGIDASVQLRCATRRYELNTV